MSKDCTTFYAVVFRKASWARAVEAIARSAMTVAASAAAGPVELNSQPSRLDELHSQQLFGGK